MSSENSEQAVDPRVDLAAMRTQLAWDRTLLAWIRSALTLMGAGVALDKGTQLLHQANVLAGIATVRNGHLVGLTLTGASTAMLGVVCWQYVESMRMLARIKSTPPARFTPALLVSPLVILLGCAVFAVLILDQRG
jgi:putative membrane protein